MYPVDDPVLSEAQRDLLRVLGYLQLQHGSASKASIIFDALVASSPPDPSLTLSHAFALLRSDQATEALAGLEVLAESEQQPPLYWLLRGQALSKLGRVAEAAHSMRMFIRQRHSGQSRA